MAQVTTLAAEDRANKGTARAIRREGKVPGVIYGDKQTAIVVALEYNVISRYTNSSSFFTHLLDLEIGGKKHRVLPRDVQYDPVSDRPIHVDFLRVSANTTIRVSVPVAFTNADKSPGIKRGGTLNIVHHEIEIVCSPDRIPEKFEISLEGLGINEAIHLSSLKLPDGTKLTTHDKDYTIATIAVPSAVRSEADDAAAAAEAAPAAGAAAPAGAAPAAGGKAAPAAAGKAAPADAKKADAKK